MFYSHELVGRKGPLASIWLAAQFPRKAPNRKIIVGTDLPNTCEMIMKPPAALSLRLRGILMHGVCIVYHRQSNFLYDDCTKMLSTIRVLENKGNAMEMVPGKEMLRLDAITLDKSHQRYRKDKVTNTKNEYISLDLDDTEFITFKPFEAGEVETRLRRQDLFQVDEELITLPAEFDIGIDPALNEVGESRLAYDDIANPDAQQLDLPANEPEADEANAILQGGDVNDDVELPQLDIDQEHQLNEGDGENDIPDRADAELETPNENKQPARKRKLRYADAFIDEDSEIAPTEYRRLIQHGTLRRSEADKDARSLQHSSLGNRSYCENLGMSHQLTLLFPPDFRRSYSKRARLSLQEDEVQTREADGEVASNRENDADRAEFLEYQVDELELPNQGRDEQENDAISPLITSPDHNNISMDIEYIRAALEASHGNPIERQGDLSTPRGRNELYENLSTSSNREEEESLIEYPKAFVRCTGLSKRSASERSSGPSPLPLEQLESKRQSLANDSAGSGRNRNSSQSPGLPLLSDLQGEIGTLTQNEVLEETLGRDAPSQTEASESALQVLAALNLIAESRPNPASPISVIELVRKQSKKHCCRFVAAILVLATNSRVEISQSMAYGNISVTL